MSYKVIITGSTGMVGKSVLLECLEDASIEEILLINRRPIEINNPKIKKILLKDFMEIDNLRGQFTSYDACFHCMGVSAVGMKEEKYHQLTFEISKRLAEAVYAANPKAVFAYVSGAGTDSSEQGKTMWARVKGKTENMILNKGFGDAYVFRPGAIIPEKGVKSSTALYNFLYVMMWPFFPLMRRSNKVINSSELGKAMIRLLETTDEKKILDPEDISRLAKNIS